MLDRIAVERQLRAIERPPRLQSERRQMLVRRDRRRAGKIDLADDRLRTFGDHEPNRDRAIRDVDALRGRQHLQVRLDRRLREPAHAIKLGDRRGNQSDARFDERLAGLELQ